MRRTLGLGVPARPEDLLQAWSLETAVGYGGDAPGGMPASKGHHTWWSVGLLLRIDGENRPAP
jgi:hypothetical protein